MKTKHKSAMPAPLRRAIHSHRPDIPRYSTEAHVGWFIVTYGDMRGTFQSGGYTPKYISGAEASEFAGHLLRMEDYETLLEWFTDWIRVISEGTERADFVSLINCMAMIKALFHLGVRKKHSEEYEHTIIRRPGVLPEGDGNDV